MMFRETLLPEANSLDIGEKVAKKSPFRKAGFSPTCKTTAHVQCHLKQTEQVQKISMKRWLSGHFRLRVQGVQEQTKWQLRAE